MNNVTTPTLFPAAIHFFRSIDFASGFLAWPVYGYVKTLLLYVCEPCSPTTEHEKSNNWRTKPCTLYIHIPYVYCHASPRDILAREPYFYRDLSQMFLFVLCISFLLLRHSRCTIHRSSTACLSTTNHIRLGCLIQKRKQRKCHTFIAFEYYYYDMYVIVRVWCLPYSHTYCEFILSNTFVCIRIAIILRTRSRRSLIQMQQHFPLAFREIFLLSCLRTAESTMHRKKNVAAPAPALATALRACEERKKDGADERKIRCHFEYNNTQLLRVICFFELKLVARLLVSTRFHYFCIVCAAICRWIMWPLRRFTLRVTQLILKIKVFSRTSTCPHIHP